MNQWNKRVGGTLRIPTRQTNLLSTRKQRAYPCLLSSVLKKSPQMVVSQAVRFSPTTIHSSFTDSLPPLWGFGAWSLLGLFLLNLLLAIWTRALAYILLLLSTSTGLWTVCAIECLILLPALGTLFLLFCYCVQLPYNSFCFTLLYFFVMFRFFLKIYLFVSTL